MAVCQMWCTQDDLCCDISKKTQQEIDDAILGASELLDRDSYRQYGICEYTIQPCGNGCSDPCFDQSCGGWAITAEVIYGVPIVEVIAVNIFDENGDAVANTYQNDVWWEGNVIFFPRDFVFPEQSGGPIGSANSWNIELTAGRAIPIYGKKAAIELATDLLKDPCEEGCVLPKEIASVSRDGASYELVDVRADDKAFAALPFYSKFYEKFCQTRRWSGIVSPLRVQSQLVQ